MRNTIIGIAIGLALAGAAFVWVSYQTPEPSVLAQPAPELKGEATKKLACDKGIEVFDRKVAKELGVPTAPNLHVADAVKIQDDGHAHTAVPVYDDQTGKISTYIRTDPLPWLDVRNRFGIGVGYGIGGQHATPTPKLDVYWQPIKVKSLTFRVTGDVTGDGQWSAWGRIGHDW